MEPYVETKKPRTMPVAFEFKGSRSALRDHRAAEAIVQAHAPDVGLQAGAVEPSRRCSIHKREFS
jgi:hypothetical protein